jgi:hypothetical protein
MTIGLWMVRAAMQYILPLEILSHIAVMTTADWGGAHGS